MKTIILFIVFTIFSFIGFSQDVIVKRDGEKIDAKVIEITKTTIKYKKFEQEDGPVRNILISEVSEIIYNNGDWEKFKEEEIVEEVEEETSSRPAPVRRGKDPFFDNGLYLDLMFSGGTAIESNTSFAYYDEFGNYYPNGIDYTYEDENSIGGINFRIGNKWYFGNGEKYRPGLQVQWMRVGIYLNPNGGYASYALSPLNIGLTNAFKFNEKHGMEVNLVGGMSFVNFVPPPFDPRVQAGVAYGIELKYRFNILAVGVDFTRINAAMNYPNRSHDFNLISLTAGIKL